MAVRLANLLTSFVLLVAASYASATLGQQASGTQDQPAPLKIPDVTVTDQDGKERKFYSDLVKGHTVVISFNHTDCTTFGPPLSATMRRVQVELGERMGREIQLITISVDPATDVPERLKAYAEKFKAGPGWTFVTGSQADIKRLLKALGIDTPNKEDHTPMLLIGNDTTGDWTRTYGLSRPSTIVELVLNAQGKSAP